eukprot:Sspe_Gene.40682::Locus_19662_Transcript_1_1_Confidence_1.000_Length_3279::g.40682::m.40682
MLCVLFSFPSPQLLLSLRRVSASMDRGAGGRPEGGYIQEVHPSYMSMRLSKLVASQITLCTCSSTERGWGMTVVSIGSGCPSAGDIVGWRCEVEGMRLLSFPLSRPSSFSSTRRMMFTACMFLSSSGSSSTMPSFSSSSSIPSPCAMLSPMAASSFSCCNASFCRPLSSSTASLTLSLLKMSPSIGVSSPSDVSAEPHSRSKTRHHCMNFPWHSTRESSAPVTLWYSRRRTGNCERVFTNPCSSEMMTPIWFWYFTFTSATSLYDPEVRWLAFFCRSTSSDRKCRMLCEMLTWVSCSCCKLSDKSRSRCGRCFTAMSCETRVSKTSTALVQLFSIRAWIASF